MHEIPLLINITIALVVAFFGGTFARRIGLPTIVGYLLAGIAIGPFTPGFVGDIHTIQQLAELGVIFLMFGVGLHFSLAALWSTKLWQEQISVPGQGHRSWRSFAITNSWPIQNQARCLRREIAPV